MNLDTRISQTFSVLHSQYDEMLGLNATGMYYKLIWINASSLGRPLTVEYISKKTGADEQSCRAALKSLWCCKLIRKSRDGGVIILFPKKLLSMVEKKSFLDKLSEHHIITNEVKSDILIKLMDKEGRVNPEADRVVLGNKDLANPTKEAGPDTFEGLVNYYYKTLGETFGGAYTSRNIRAESKTLGETIKRNNDTPEQTRQMMKFIMERAKGGNKFDQVGTLGLYHSFRNKAYYHLFVDGAGDRKFETIEAPVKSTFEDIEEVYNFHISNGKEQSVATDIIRNAFDKEDVDTFLNKLNAV